MNTAKGVMIQLAGKLIFAWAVGCILVGIFFAGAIENWHPGFDNHPWGVVIGCLCYFALIIPIVWLLRRKPTVR